MEKKKKAMLTINFEVDERLVSKFIDQIQNMDNADYRQVARECLRMLLEERLTEISKKMEKD